MSGLPHFPLAPLALVLAVHSGPAICHISGQVAAANRLDFALSKYNKASNNTYHSCMVQVLRAPKQVVSGLNYFLDVELGQTTCTKSHPNLVNCPFYDQPRLKKRTFCSFHIYSVPWMGSISMVRSSCQDA
ncbi:cystatin-C-like [Erinaceus europaeus]|uniref:Cystatin-C-like n=1 Tax=Erinaceus europaeus TaxID=9365 RepID=A0ABM3VTL1_ERIEU|nr:cystatin-C-like [Erinaceus europaeus]